MTAKGGIVEDGRLPTLRKREELGPRGHAFSQHWAKRDAPTFFDGILVAGLPTVKEKAV
jgi:hypothetical protein